MYQWVLLIKFSCLRYFKLWCEQDAEMATTVLKLLSTKMCQSRVLTQAQMLRPRLLAWVVTLDYSVDQRQKEQQLLKGMLHKKKERFKESGQILLKDIKEARDKVRERMEEVIEASPAAQWCESLQINLFDTHSSVFWMALNWSCQLDARWSSGIPFFYL